MHAPAGVDAPIPKQTLGTRQGTYFVKAGFSLFIPIAAVIFFFCSDE